MPPHDCATCRFLGVSCAFPRAPLIAKRERRTRSTLRAPPTHCWRSLQSCRAALCGLTKSTTAAAAGCCKARPYEVNTMSYAPSTSESVRPTHKPAAHEAAAADQSSAQSPVLPGWLASLAATLPPLIPREQIVEQFPLKLRGLSKAIASGELVAVRISNKGSSRVLIARDPFLAWLESRTVAPRPNVAARAEAAAAKVAAAKAAARAAARAAAATAATTPAPAPTRAPGRAPRRPDADRTASRGK